MKELGNQLVVELYGCNRNCIEDVAFVEETMVQAAHKAKATIVQSIFHEFSPHGVSGAVIIAESHLAIHTWPEFGYCALDVFTCGNLTDNSAALDYIKDAFQADYYSAMELKRGLLNLPDDQIKHKPDAK